MRTKITLSELIGKLHQDLHREYQHMLYYLRASTSVAGLHREEYREFFTKAAESEMQHVQEWSDLIIGLGGHADVLFLMERDNQSSVSKMQLTAGYASPDPKQLLATALSMENDVVSNYCERIEDAIELQNTDPVNGKFVEIFLEDQLMDSRKDADHIKMLLKDI